MQLTKSHLALAAAVIALSVAEAAAQSPPEKPKLVVATEEASKAPPLDVATCQACHETALSKPFLKSYHAGLENACASCHKGAAEHSEAMQAGKEGVPAPSLTKLKAAELNMVCLTCHEKGKQANWHGGVHERRGLGCISCHAVHNYQSEQHQLKTARDPRPAYTCHAAIRARTCGRHITRSARGS
jgi:hypothetical protein